MLFASGSLWEGIDLPGDILSSLIIVKLPFSVPDPVSNFEQRVFESFNDYKEQIVFPDMVLKLMQGYGRLIRKETDTGVVAILDYRMRIGGAYREKVLAALPRCMVTQNIKDVTKFIKLKKDSDYYKN